MPARQLFARVPAWGFLLALPAACGIGFLAGMVCGRVVGRHPSQAPAVGLIGEASAPGTPHAQAGPDVSEADRVLEKTVKDVFIRRSLFWKAAAELICQLEVPAGLEMGTLAFETRRGLRYERIGPGHAFFGSLTGPFELRTGTVREVLDLFCEANPRFSWSINRGVVILKHASAMRGPSPRREGKAEPGGPLAASPLDVKAPGFRLGALPLTTTCRRLFAGLDIWEGWEERHMCTVGFHGLGDSPLWNKCLRAREARTEGFVVRDRTVRDCLVEVARTCGRNTVWLCYECARPPGSQWMVNGRPRKSEWTIRLATWSTLRSQRSLEELLAGLDPDDPELWISKYERYATAEERNSCLVPHSRQSDHRGYDHPRVRVEDFWKELDRRCHFHPVKVASAMQQSGSIRCLMRDWDGGGNWWGNKNEIALTCVLALQNEEVNRLFAREMIELQDPMRARRVMSIVPPPETFRGAYAVIWDIFSREGGPELAQLAAEDLSAARQSGQGRVCSGEGEDVWIDPFEHPYPY